MTPQYICINFGMCECPECRSICIEHRANNMFHIQDTHVCTINCRQCWESLPVAHVCGVWIVNMPDIAPSASLDTPYIRFHGMQNIFVPYVHCVMCHEWSSVHRNLFSSNGAWYQRNMRSKIVQVLVLMKATAIACIGMVQYSWHVLFL